jgi:sigma-B regulation protein RsbU (phosphoserine phosphatase)
MATGEADARKAGTDGAAHNGAVRVLVAEDSATQAQLLSAKLRAAGYDVRVAADGALALESIRADPPTIVISDIEMPNMTGYELCSAVKNDPELRRIPFILLSTLSSPEDIIRGLHCGAENYVTKPYDPDFLLSRVDSLLRTPTSDEEEAQELDVTLAGTRYTVKAGRQQVLNLLVSTFENAVEKNNELIQTNQKLTIAKEQLTAWNQKLENLNGELEVANTKMSTDLHAAARVQQSLLPAESTAPDGVRVAWQYKPCDELAGDFLNFFPIDDKHLALFVVDVCGHGVASSLLSVTAGHLLTPHVSSSALLARTGEGGELHIVPPREVALELNRRFPMAEQDGLYFTMLYGVLALETLEFRYVLAGHPQLVHVPEGGDPTLVDARGMAIGWVIDEFMCDEHVLQLARGDRLYLYSDGVPEAMDPNGKQLGDKQMLEVLELGRSQSLGESVDLLMDVVERWAGGEGLNDDVSILGVEIETVTD